MTDHFGELLNSLLEQALSAIPETDAAEIAPQLSTGLIEQFSAEVRKGLLKGAKASLTRDRRSMAGFEKRHFKRWRRAFDLLELIWLISADLGSTFNNEFRPTAQERQDHLFEALTHIHARSLLVANEAICLMKGGFADGALSRWRTLHEHSVIAVFLMMHGSDIAFRYLASFDFQALKSARQAQKYAERAKLDPPTAEEITILENRCAGWIQKFGSEMNEEFGWTFPILKVPRANLFSLEVHTGLDHWRPRFRRASQHTHGQHRPARAQLGTSEREEPVFLIGQSNSGLVDPMQMVAISLVHVTASLLLSQPNVDRTVAVHVVLKMSDELGPLALKIERETLERARAKERK
jgi:Family of unknown function (DUF5677)